VTSWDLKHVSAGATLHVFRSDFTLGASAGFSSQKVPPLGLAERVLGPNPDLESHVMMVTVLAGWKLVF
jgi:hypothetical protein